tara:strand:- start:424 stop:2430 length:2007 start_codon:yes stop_codon:yes gene_type:complete
MTTITSSETLKEQIRWGKYLLRMAWALEIIAATIGLLIAWSFGYTVYIRYVNLEGSFPLDKFFDVLIAGLPFVMVAAVELVKIPLCRVVYTRTTLKVKIIFSVVLLAVTAITFETLILGFERQFNNMAIEVREPQNKLALNEEKIKNNEVQILRLQNTTEDSIIAAAELLRDEAYKNKEAAKKPLVDKKEEIKSKEKKPLETRKNNLNNDLKTLKTNRDDDLSRKEENTKKLIERHESLITAAEKLRDDKIATIRDRAAKLSAKEKLEADQLREANQVIIGEYKNSILEKKAEIREKERQIAALTTADRWLGGQDNAINKDIDNLNDDIAFLESEIQRLLNENTKLSTSSDVVLVQEIASANEIAQKVINQNQDKISQLISDEIAFREATEDKYIKARNDIQNQIADIDIKLVAESKDQQKIDSIDEEINQLERDFRAELGKIKSKQSNDLQELADDDNEIKALENEMTPWINENAEYRQIIIEKYKDTQVYRIAQTFYKLEEGELISAEQIAKVSFFWFGSLATIVSIMGVVLAFGAFILKNTPPDGGKNRRGTGPIGRAFRKTLASRRKKYNAPKIKKVEVEKIVEVEKEVIKEVPVEKIVKVDKEVVVEVPKIVEVPVPVDVVKKEVVHYPIFTNDPDYLKFSKTKFTDLVGDTEKKKKKKKDDE